MSGDPDFSEEDAASVSLAAVERRVVRKRQHPPRCHESQSYHARATALGLVGGVLLVADKWW